MVEPVETSEGPGGRARQDHVRSRFDYDGKDTEIVDQPDPKIVQRGIDAVGD